MSPDDPGLQGVVPFRFHCHRCGHCCTAGEGHVWLEEGEVERLAAHHGCTPEAFERSHVRVVPDPVDGRLRASLLERDGRCSLLEKPCERSRCCLDDRRAADSALQAPSRARAHST